MHAYQCHGAEATAWEGVNDRVWSATEPVVVVACRVKVAAWALEAVVSEVLFCPAQETIEPEFHDVRSHSLPELAAPSEVNVEKCDGSIKSRTCTRGETRTDYIKPPIEECIKTKRKQLEETEIINSL
ncbi:hypothetical protein pipiens_014700 [Culex pipiens pipiens]|uniref:Uncharacterized protein n=1 Tax=Culex pipiens pipiens TaxID=38569 RepID=A0ABD1CVK8_CULPP